MWLLRPSRADDHEAVLALADRRDRVDLGGERLTQVVLADHWRSPSFQPERDAVVAEDGGEVVGYGALLEPGGLGLVDPASKGRGIGRRLVEWIEAHARRDGREQLRHWVPRSDEAAGRLLRSAGYVPLRTVRHMAVTLPGPAAGRPLALPAGLSAAALDVERDADDLHRADGTMFAANADYEPVSLESFLAEHLDAPDLDPACSRVARRGSEVAGFVLCRRWEPGLGLVDLLAVGESERRRGLGTWLLLTAFEEMAAAGLTEARLEVASDNAGAVALYERLGMRVRCEIQALGKRLR